MSEPYWVPLAAQTIPPAVPSWEKIAEAAFSGATAYDISSIPQTYRHLRLIAKLRNSNPGYLNNSVIRFQGDSAANYRGGYLRGYNGSAGHFDSGSTIIDLGLVCATNAHAEAFSLVEILIPNYRDDNFRVVGWRTHTQTGQNGLDQMATSVGSAIWANDGANALTQINLMTWNGGLWSVGCSFTLEGRA